jgi:hypothetical protein
MCFKKLLTRVDDVLTIRHGFFGGKLCIDAPRRPIWEMSIKAPWWSLYWFGLPRNDVYPAAEMCSARCWLPTMKSMHFDPLRCVAGWSFGFGMSEMKFVLDRKVVNRDLGDSISLLASINMMVVSSCLLYCCTNFC